MNIDLERRERRLRRVERLTRQAGDWPISVLVSWFVVEAATKLAPDDPVPSFEAAARHLVRCANDVKTPGSTTLLAASMEGVVARHLRERDEDALLRHATDLALAFEEACRHAGFAGSLGRVRAAITVPLAHSARRKPRNQRNQAWHP
ncbi:MAG: hypothetical protein ACXVEF_40415 [Polyangiales bacterium]